MKKLILPVISVIGLLFAGSTLALKLEVYNSIKGHTPVAVTFASEKGHGVKAEEPLIVFSGEEKSKDVVLGVSLQQITINGNMIKLSAREGKALKGAFWRLELTEGTNKQGCPMIKYDLYKIPEGRARKDIVKSGVVEFIALK